MTLFSGFGSKSCLLPSTSIHFLDVVVCLFGGIGRRLAHERCDFLQTDVELLFLVLNCENISLGDRLPSEIGLRLSKKMLNTRLFLLFDLLD